MTTQPEPLAGHGANGTGCAEVLPSCPQSPSVLGSRATCTCGRIYIAARMHECICWSRTDGPQPEGVTP
jgi:hypothetical protein